MPARRVLVACSILLACVAVAVAVAVAAATLARAQDRPPAPPATSATTKPTQDQLLAAFLKYGRPGPEHKLLKQLVGKFDAEMTTFVDGQPAGKSAASSTNAMIHKGRYLHGDFTGSVMGRPFSGSSLWAFDRAKGKYLSLWIDDMSTAVMIAEGDADAAGKVITFTGTERDPITGQDKKIKSVLTILDDDRHTWEAFETIDRQERKVLSIAYTRAK
jgi:hypothetical protein